jgi:polyisoprenoid-binding protein YceI
VTRAGWLVIGLVSLVVSGFSRTNSDVPSITGAAANAAYRVDGSKSRATIHVGKAGAFSFLAGHSHEVSGPIQSGSVDVDPGDPGRSRVQLIIAAADLQVAAEREPEGDAPKVQEAMAGDKVLDVAHHPRITYASSAVTLKDRQGTVLNVNVTGQLTIRGVMREVTAPVRVELGDTELRAIGHFSIKQSVLGIKPISVGGVVAVKDALDIEFSIVARK